MKNSLLISILVLSANIVIAQLPGEKEWKKSLVNNRVQSQVQWNHKYEKGKPKKDGYKNFTKRFDHNGNVIEEVYYQSGTIDQKLSYKYDNKDNQVEYANYKGDEGKLLYKQNITYDNFGKKIREERFNGTEYQIIKYNYSGDKLLEITRSDIYGYVEHKRVFNYTGDVCIVDIKDDQSNVIGKLINKYDENNNIIESTEYDEKDNIKEKYIYKFDGKLLKEKTKYAGENFIYRETYKYNSKNLLDKVLKEKPEGNTITNNIYTYDSEGKLIEEQWYDNNPSENSKKTYYYNKKGLLEKVEVYYSLYRYRIQYKYEYTFY
ncbi:MAG: hypothetical protein C0597_06915 [Marinilabiliales bacterium]|nr:MAG: hypothetical protein C0597_06915 [Marinilabiliales bacterium]